VHARLQVSVCSGYDYATLVNIQTCTHRQHLTRLYDPLLTTTTYMAVLLLIPSQAGSQGYLCQLI